VTPICLAVQGAAGFRTKEEDTPALAGNLVCRGHLRTASFAHHVTNILHKLGVASRLEAAAWVHGHIPDDLWDDEAQAT